MNEINSTQNIIELPRGGFLVKTTIGDIQFGSPPETIKDTMLLQGGVPHIYVLPAEMFSWVKGISIAEIEFPIYYNFFLKNKKTYIICRAEQFHQMKTVLHESVFGPKNLDLSADFVSDYMNIPDLQSEIDYFRGGRKLSDLISFGLFKNNSFTFKGVKIEIDESGNFSVTEKNKTVKNIPGKINYKPTYKIGQRLPEPYIPPLFGVTCLGPSHGFDPEENTSGFIIWLNHQGVMVDPPVNSTEWLEDSNVNPKFIDSIILTHCHADHDAGTFQKILEEGKVTIYTTETVMMSFLRKYSALTGVSEEYLMKLFVFHPVKIGSPVFINGGKFDMFYTLHSIPTIGFSMEFQDQTFVYTSDHNNDPELHSALFDSKVITKERYDSLKNFPWDSRVIYHESGVPPLHTPVAYLNSLPPETRKKIVVYHIAGKDFPEDTDLTLAKFGMEHTLYFETQPPAFEKSYLILGILKRLDFFQDAGIEKAQEFINIVEEEKYSKGDIIIRKGTRGDKFYIIYSGNVSVDSGGLQKNKIYGAYDYFGEVALVTGGSRAADVKAETDIVVYTIERDKFLNFIVGTEFEKTLKRLARVRNSETWNLLSMSESFRQCTASQITWLESIFIPMEMEREGILIKENTLPDYACIISKGEVFVSRRGQDIAVLKRGDLVGSFMEIDKEEPSAYSFSYKDNISIYAMRREDVKRFISHNPGLLMKIDYPFRS